MTDSQEGVPLYLDIQFIDTAYVCCVMLDLWFANVVCRTCEPVSAIYIDLSHANSTGVYSGVPLSDDSNKNVTTKLDNTFLRGLQQTDVNGVVQFETVFPGHYEGATLLLCLISYQVLTYFLQVEQLILTSCHTSSMKRSRDPMALLTLLILVNFTLIKI